MKTTGGNSTYKKLAVQWLNEPLCFVSSSVVVDSFRLRNRQFLVAANRTTKDGYNLFRKVDYTNTEAGVGPLGSGVYVQYNSEDGSRFDERFISSDGNSIPSFTADNVNITNFRNLETRLNARLIEKTIENVLVAGGHDRTQVEEDVMILDHPRFAGYFATFRGQTSVNYESDIPVDFFDPSDSHGSTSSRTFPEFFNSDAALKFYDGAASAADNIPNHIGIVRTSFSAHAVEAIRAFADDDVNINAENAERIKTEIEKQ